jgi:hypothetical protein
VVTLFRLGYREQAWQLAAQFLVQPVAAVRQRDLVLCPASHRTGATRDALPGIYNEGVSLFPLSHGYTFVTLTNVS